jgi:hypothetical protein
VVAIPGGIRTGRCLAVMMLGDGAVVSRTASHASSRPSSNDKGSVQQCNRQQAETSGDDWPAIWNPNAQGAYLLLPDITSKYSTVHGISWTFGRNAFPEGQYCGLANCSVPASCLDLTACASQTRLMHNTFLVFEFGANEEAAQQARHKLESWRQAFRLDKKLQFKFDRGQAAADGDAAKTEKVKAKGKAKSSEAAADSGDVQLLVRLYFSGHEKLSHQRWVDRIPSEEPFKGASPKLVRQDDPGFDSIEKKFQNLE